MTPSILKILLIEDDFVCQEAASDLLKTHYNCRIDTAENATDALELINNSAMDWDVNGYDIILVDIFLPDIKGDLWANIIRKTEEKVGTIPIIAVSGKLKKKDKKFLQINGVTDLLLKPLTFKTLHQTLQKYINADTYIR